MKSVQLVQILNAFSSAPAGGQAQRDVGAFRVHGDRLQLGPQHEIYVFHWDCSQQHLNRAHVGHRAPVSIGQGTHLQSLQPWGSMGWRAERCRKSSLSIQVKGVLPVGMPLPSGDVLWNNVPR